MVQQNILHRRAVMAVFATVAFATLILAGCASVVQPYAVRKGIARDYIFSVEPW